MAKTAKKDSTLTLEEKLEQALVPNTEYPYKVPDNWCWVTIGTLVELLNGYAFKSAEYVDYGIRIIRITNVQDGYVEDEKPVFYPMNLTNEFEKYMLSENDLLISLTGNVGRVALLSADFLPAALNQRVGCLRIRKNAPLNIKFLFYCFLRKEFQDACIENAKGSAQLNMSTEWLKEQAMPMPPLSEQQRIVDRIESLFAKLDEAKEKAQAVVDGYEDRKAAILHKAFTGELTEKWRETRGLNLSDWRKMQIRQIGEIITGSTPSTANREYYGGSIPFVKPLELNQGRHVSFSENTLTEAGKAVSRPIRAGATCICCIGATISKCGFLDVDSVTNQQINSIIPYEFMDDVFVYYYCCSKEFKDALIDNSSSTTLPIINKSKMSALSIVVPSKCEQIAISAILDNAFSDEQNAKDAAEQVIDHIETMKKSILARAFRGELGTNDPKDESAIELLKSIL